ncbi:MAG: hypothetical protein VX966_05365 [Chloroflexota bacterium]|nr:hypothetical protein [Chloroflexota bacterium]
MLENPKYKQVIQKCLGHLKNQRAVTFILIGFVIICIILVVLAYLFPSGFKIDNSEVQVKPDYLVENSGVLSKYTSSEAITLLKTAINNGEIDSPRCSLTEGEFHTFFSHRKYWKIAILCPPESEGLHRASKEYLYELSEWDDSIKHTPID